MSTLLASDNPRDVRQPAGHAPLRRAESVRRTSSLEVSWPEGREQPSHVLGIGRDIHTTQPSLPPLLLARDELSGRLQGRTIVEIDASPARAGIEKLVGERGGGYLRTALDTALPAEQEGGTPLYLLIDDLSGTSLVAGWAWEGWQPERESTEDPDAREARMDRMTGVCTGFAPGSMVHSGWRQNHVRVVPLTNPADPAGWHELRQLACPSLRRARRIDVWLEDGVIQVDSAFQDSAASADGGRIAVHEYQLRASADLHSGRLLSLHAEPCVLPYPDCPKAVANIGELVGVPMRELRMEVLRKLRRTRGCTHLNDALRALAEVPVLAAQLQQRTARVG
jgi:hypothetical protein